MGKPGKGKGEKGGWSVGVGRNEIRRWSGVSREQSQKTFNFLSKLVQSVGFTDFNELDRFCTSLTEFDSILLVFRFLT